MHPAKDGFAALPFFDDFDLSTIDILVISQYVDGFSPLVFLVFPFSFRIVARLLPRIETAAKGAEELKSTPYNVSFPTFSLNMYYQKTNTILNMLNPIASLLVSSCPCIILLGDRRLLQAQLPAMYQFHPKYSKYL